MPLDENEGTEKVDLKMVYKKISGWVGHEISIRFLFFEYFYIFTGTNLLRSLAEFQCFIGLFRLLFGNDDPALEFEDSFKINHEYRKCTLHFHAFQAIRVRPVISMNIFQFTIFRLNFISVF